MYINRLEQRQDEEVRPLVWEEVSVTDENLIAELLEFWARQSQADARNRFFSGSMRAGEIENRYRHAFRFTRIALAIRDGGRLVGFFLGTVDPKKPEWISTSVEIDREYRGRGLAREAHQKMYEMALSLGLAGLRGEILMDNEASIAMVKRFCQDKPHHFCQRGDVIYYYAGVGAVDIIDLDLLD